MHSFDFISIRRKRDLLRIIKHTLLTETAKIISSGKNRDKNSNKSTCRPGTQINNQAYARWAYCATFLLMAGAVAPALIAKAEAATITVTNINDSGAGSLRQAILDAETTAEADQIIFALPNNSIIALASVLPSITTPMTIGNDDRRISINGSYGKTNLFFIRPKSSDPSGAIAGDQRITVKFVNLALAYGFARGGNGGRGLSGGGGGMGAGGGAFVGSGSDVEFDRVNFDSNIAQGGDGGFGSSQGNPDGTIVHSYGGGGGGGGLNGGIGGDAAIYNDRHAGGGGGGGGQAAVSHYKSAVISGDNAVGSDGGDGGSLGGGKGGLPGSVPKNGRLYGGGGGGSADDRDQTAAGSGSFGGGGGGGGGYSGVTIYPQFYPDLVPRGSGGNGGFGAGAGGGSKDKIPNNGLKRNLAAGGKAGFGGGGAYFSTRNHYSYGGGLGEFYGGGGMGAGGHIFIEDGATVTIKGATSFVNGQVIGGKSTKTFANVSISEESLQGQGEGSGAFINGKAGLTFDLQGQNINIANDIESDGFNNKIQFNQQPYPDWSKTPPGFKEDDPANDGIDTGVTITGPGIAKLGGDNTFIGGLHINNGAVVEVGADNNLGGIDPGYGLNNDGDYGKIVFKGNSSLNVKAGFTSNRKVEIVDNNAKIDVPSAQTLTMVGKTVGPGGMIKTSAGILNLNADNSYYGDADVQGGIVNANGNDSLAQGKLKITTGTRVNIADTKTQHSSGLEGGGNIAINGADASLMLDQEYNSNFSGIIEGSGTISKNGGGILTLSGTNNFTGTVLAEQGVLRIASPSNSVLKSIVANGARIDYVNGAKVSSVLTLDSETDLNVINAGDIAEHSGMITGDFGFNKVGAGTLIISSPTNNYTGSAVVKDGVLQIADGQAVGSGLLVGAGGQIIYNGRITVETELVLDRDTSITVSSRRDNATHNGSISGSGKLIKAGDGTLRLGGSNNTYTGGTQVVSGNLEAMGDYAFGDGGILTVNQNAIAIIRQSDQYIYGLEGTGGVNILGTASNTASLAVEVEDGAVDTFTGTITANSDSKFIKLGPGKQIIAGVTDISRNFIFGVKEGILAAGKEQVFDQSVLEIDTGAQVDLDSNNQIVAGLSGGGQLKLGVADLTIGVDIGKEYNFAGFIEGNGSITKNDTGTQIMSGANNAYVGDTVINGGILRAEAENTLGSQGELKIASEGSMVLTSFNQKIAGFSGVGSLDLGSAALTTDQNHDTTFAGGITNDGSIVKAGTGTLTISRDNLFSGGVKLKGGMVEIIKSDSLGLGPVEANGGGLIYSNKVDVDNPVTMMQPTKFQVNAGDGAVHSGLISGNGKIIKIGDGALDIGGKNDFLGGASLEQGKLTALIDGALGSDDIEGKGGALGYGNGVSLANNIIMTTDTRLEVEFSDFKAQQSGIISGPGKMIKSGAGGLTLNSQTTNTGGTWVQSGYLYAGVENAISEGELQVDISATFSTNGFDQVVSSFSGQGNLELLQKSTGGDITINQLADGEFQGRTIGNGSLTKAGVGKLTVSGDFQHTGNTVLEGGTLKITGAIKNGTVIARGGKLELARDAYVNAPTNIEADLEIIVDEGSARYEGAITGVLGSGHKVIKTGQGELVLASDNTLDEIIVKEGSVITDNTNTGFGGGTLKVEKGAFVSLNNSQEELTKLEGDGNIEGAYGDIYVTQAEDTTFSGRISGDILLYKSGFGLLTLSGDNSYTAGVIINNGGIRVENNNALGIGVLYINDSARLEYADNVTIANDVNISGEAQLWVKSGIATHSGNIIDSGAYEDYVNKLGLGKLVSSGANNSYGYLLVDDGELEGGANNAFGTVLEVGSSGVADTGNFKQTVSGIVGKGNVVIGSDGSGQLQVDTYTNMNVDATITGAGKLIKAQTSALFLNGKNSNTGGIDILGGAIVAVNNSSFGTGLVTFKGIGEFGTVISYGDNLNIANPLYAEKYGSIYIDDSQHATQSGKITGAEKIDKVGGGTLELTNNGNDNSGDWYIKEGFVKVSASKALGTGSIIASGGSLIYADGVNVANSVEMQQASSIMVDGSDYATHSGNIGGDTVLNKVGTGILELTSNENKNTGGIGVNQGTLKLSASQAAGTGIISGLGGSLIYGDKVCINNQLNFEEDTMIKVVAGENAIQSGLVAGSGKLTKNGAGTLVLAKENNTYEGGTTLNSGFLAITSLSSLGVSSLDVNGGSLTFAENKPCQ